MEKADCVCFCKHRTANGVELCLNNRSPVGPFCDSEDTKRKIENMNCSMDYDWKTPLLDDTQNCMNTNSKAPTIPETGSGPASAETQEPLAASSTPGNIQQENVSSHQRHSPSISREDLANDISFSDDREFDFLKKAPLLPRSSSLKSRKTPPPGTTPTHRKSVRFADALGLDLELVRHILNPDEPPHVPSNALRFLQTAKPLVVVSYWRVCFPQPVTCGNLEHRVLQNKISLETCSINNSNRRVYGVVRVANVAYEKDVRVRYTLNGWLTHEDVLATYIEHSNDLITDRFSFDLRIPDQLLARSRMEFVVMFSAANQTFCDNNFDRNYAVECVEYHAV